MHVIAKMLVNEDGEKYPYGNSWHATTSTSGSKTLLCTLECFDEEGQSDSEGFAKCEVKVAPRGGITCPECLDFIKEIKSIVL